MVGFSAALGGNRVWSCCLCGAVGIRALDQVPKQTLNSFHMFLTTDPMGGIHSLRSLTLSVYCSLKSSKTDTPHCNLAARTQTYVRTPCYRISIKHSLITAHRGVCKYRIIQNSSGEDKSHTAAASLKSHTDDDTSARSWNHSGLTFKSYLKWFTMIKINKGKFKSRWTYQCI